MRKIVMVGALGLALAAAGRAEIQFIEGPAKADVGDQGVLEIPKGWRFVPKESMEEFDKASENLYSPDELGVLLAPKGLKGGFWAFFQFEDIGYIKDAASEKMDPDQMWETMTKSSVQANKAREEKGWPAMEMARWEKKPEYNPQTQRLEWAIWFKSGGKEFLNFNTRLLGRKGVMRVTLVPNDAPLETVLPQFNEVVRTFEYNPGNKYAEWVAGDKVAKYGLAALVVGGAGTLALKSGLLQKLWKLVVVGFLAAGAFLKKIWNALTGRKEEETR